MSPNAICVCIESGANATAACASCKCLIELFCLNEILCLLHFADRSRQRHLKLPVKDKHTAIDYSRRFNQLELTVRIKRTGPNSTPDRLLALISTGPSIEPGTSMGRFSHNVLIVGKGLHGIP
jgi:hypothetical protein